MRTTLNKFRQALEQAASDAMDAADIALGQAERVGGAVLRVFDSLARDPHIRIAFAVWLFFLLLVLFEGSAL